MARIKIAKSLVLGALLFVSFFAPIAGLAQAAEPAVAIPPPALDATAPADGGSADGGAGRRLLLGRAGGL